MTYDDFNAFCGSLPATTHVIQWRGAHVWKVGGKVFAIGGWGDDAPAITFKTSDILYEILRDAPGYRPAPYLASRGMKWIQCHELETAQAATLRDHVQSSYDLVASALPKKTKSALGLI